MLFLLVFVFQKPRDGRLSLNGPFQELHAAMDPNLRPAEPPRQRRSSLASRRTSLSNRPRRLSLSKHIMALETTDESMASFGISQAEKRAIRHAEYLHDSTYTGHHESIAGSALSGDMASARRYVREVARKTAEDEKGRSRESVQRREANAMGVELIKKQFMLLKVAIYICPIFYFFGNHEHFLTIVMFVWLSQQLQVFKPTIDRGSY